MGGKVDYVSKRYLPLKDKDLRAALAHKIGKEFPRIGGARILDLCADMVLEVIDDHVRSRENLSHGQVLWLGYSIDDPPKQYRRTRDSDLVPVVLDLVTPEDIDLVLERAGNRERRLQKALRLCRQAYEQGALLSNCDLAMMMNITDSGIASLLCEYERKTGKIVPRRSTLHDMGSGLTHKRIICLKRYAQGKEPHQIAEETYHGLESVDRYLGQYDRVRHCRLQGLGVEETAYTLNMGLSLVREYLAIDDELGASD